MKTICFIHVIFLSFFLASCTSSDDETLVNDGERKFRHLIITQVEDDAGTRSLFNLTRATLKENGDIISASWETNDNITYCNLTDADSYYHENDIIYHNLIAESTSPTSTIAGSAVCANGDYLALIYPSGNFSYYNRNVSSHYPVQYTLNISGQDGTIDKLANQYHYVFGEVIVAVKDDNASGEVTLESLLAVCRFSFIYNDEKIHIEKLAINYLSTDDYGGKYPISATLIAYPGYHNLNPVILESDPVLEINPPSGTSPEDVYVALLPTGSNGRTFRFTVNDTYYCEAEAILNAGEFYPTILNLNKLNN